MALDPQMEQMANKMAAGRVAAGRGAPAMPVPEEMAPEAPAGLGEVRMHLQAAMELLDALEGGGVGAGEVM